MFGHNPIAPIINRDNDGSYLQLVKGSPFSTIQGEGPFTGRRATFIRLHGCNLRCTFCDTQFSDPKDPTWLVNDILTSVREFPNELVVITGGEPMRQNIRLLCKQLIALGHIVQIETAGTLWVNGLDALTIAPDHVPSQLNIVCSPKTPSIHPMILKYATCFKYVIDYRQKFEGYVPITATQAGAAERRLAAPREGATVYLSPMDTGDEIENALNRKLVGTLAMKYQNTVAGIQLHKFMDLD